MAVAFDRTLRALSAEKSRGALLWIVGLVLFVGVWMAWLLAVHVPLKLATREARLESKQSLVALTVPIEGQVRRSFLRLGQVVKKGQLLLELTDQVLRLKIAEEQASLEALKARVRVLQQQLGQDKKTVRLLRKVARKADSELKMRYQRERLQAQEAGQQLTQALRLSKKGYIAREKLRTARLEARKRRIAARELLEQSERVRWEYRVKGAEQRTRLAELARSLRNVKGQLAVRKVMLVRRKAELAQHRLRAPEDGKISSVIPIAAGAVVRKGHQLGSLLPVGRVHVVAQFAAAEGMGKVRAGQQASVRLHAFPWTQYGALQARVHRVARVAHKQRLRVELALEGKNPRIPIQHGLTGTVEIEVEQVTPLALLLRIVGKWVESPVVGAQAGPGQAGR